MDMKRILQAMDGITTQPVVGVSDMSKFLTIIKKNDVEILNEGSPHKVALPVQMAMKHYQQPQSPVIKKDSILGQYFHTVEEEIKEQKTSKRQLINQYASVIAKKVLVKEGTVVDFPKKHEFHDKLTHCPKCKGELQGAKIENGERVKVCVPCLKIFHNRTAESTDLNERSTSEKQARTMAAAAHNPEFAKKVGIKTSVAKEFNKADKGTKQLSNAMKHKKTKESSNGGVVKGHSGQFTGGVGAPGLQSNEPDGGNLSLYELSTDKLGKYKTAAAADASKADKEGDFKRGNKRFSGIVKATKKQFDNETKEKNPIKEANEIIRSLKRSSSK